jgi:hypothetical protein
MTKQREQKATKRSSASTRATNDKNGNANGARVTFDQIDAMAKEWLRLWSNPATRPQMDAVIAHLRPEDQSRVVLWAQRLSKDKTTGITIKEAKESNGKKTKKR